MTEKNPKPRKQAYEKKDPSAHEQWKRRKANQTTVQTWTDKGWKRMEKQ